MAFTQSTINEVRVARLGAELRVSWTSSDLWGTTFQVYLDRRLVWFGLSRFCVLPIPANAQGRNTWVEVGTVGPGEANHDFSGSLSGPAGSGNRVQLTWSGGTYLDPTGRNDVAGYKIFRSSSPGGPVNYQSPVDMIAAYPGGVITDGFGMGGFGAGGFGRAASTYIWRSSPLASGTWTFAVGPFDHAGNAQGSPGLVTATVSGPPRPPALGAQGGRLFYTFSGPSTRLASLQWLASPV